MCLLVPCETVLRWFAAYWKETDSALVQESFLQCGLCNALDGTQDNKRYSDCVVTWDALTPLTMTMLTVLTPGRTVMCEILKYSM